MAKYRLLSSKELEELKPEFIEYLILNGIVADDWEQLKKDEPDKAERIIDLFSDVILESIMQKVSFLDFRDDTEVKSFQCLKDKLIMYVSTSRLPPHLVFVCEDCFYT